MRRVHKLAWGLLFIAPVAWGIAKPLVLPRTGNGPYLTEGFFEGGEAHPSNIDGLKLRYLGETERWSIDFSPITRLSSKRSVPRFQLKYTPAEKGIRDTGEWATLRPAKLTLNLRNIRKNALDENRLQRLVKQSKHVERIHVYPPIEEGDTAIEIVFKDSVSFLPHLPGNRSSSLVIDVKDAAPNTF
jgi:hypothetical protein